MGKSKGSPQKDVIEPRPPMIVFGHLRHFAGEYWKELISISVQRFLHICAVLQKMSQATRVRRASSGQNFKQYTGVGDSRAWKRNQLNSMIMIQQMAKVGRPCPCVERGGRL